MTRVSDIYSFLCELAPLELQMDFDNAGIQVGHLGAEVSKVLLSLDITSEVISEAVNEHVQLIISHHPLIFGGINSAADDSVTGKKILALAENKIAAVSMHTNLDIAEGGVNDVLMKSLGAVPEGALDSAGCGRVGTLEKEMSMNEFISVCKAVLHTKGLRYYDAGKPVSRIAVMGGAGGSELMEAYNCGCDTYITSDIKYSQFLDAKELGINLIDGDHFGTEDPVMPELCRILTAKFPDTRFLVSKRHKQIVSFA